MHRRTLLKIGLASTAALTLLGALALRATSGLQQGRLTDSGRLLFASLARAMLDGSLPAERGAAERALTGLLDRLDTLIGVLSAPVQDEVSQLVGVLTSGLGRRAVATLTPDWPQASVPELQDALQRMRFSELTLRQQAYLALHELICGAYFSDATTWAAMGYPGPRRI